MKKFLQKYLKKDVKETFSLAKDHGIVKPPVTGYLNPFWKIKFSHKGKEILSIPFSIMVVDYLKRYGFEPESRIIPSIKIDLDLGLGAPLSCPLFVHEKCTFQDNITIDEALKKGMIYKSFKS